MRKVIYLMIILLVMTTGISYGDPNEYMFPKPVHIKSIDPSVSIQSIATGVQSVTIDDDLTSPIKPYPVELNDNTLSPIGVSGNPVVVDVGTPTVVMPDPVITKEKYDKVVSSTPYVASLATNSVTLLSSIASFTVPCIIEFDHQGTQWIGLATSTVASVQNKRKYRAYDKHTVKPSSSTYDVGLAADPTATSSVVITVHELGE